MNQELAPASFHSEPWIDEVYRASLKERTAIAEKLLSTLNQDEEASQLLQSLTDPKEFVKLQFIPYIYYVPMRGGQMGKVRHLKLKTPAVALKHKRLPLLLGATYEMKDAGKEVDIDYVSSFPPNIRQILSYGKTLTRLSSQEKRELYDLLLDGIRSYRKGNERRKEWLSDYLESGKDFEVLGFALNHSYINVDPGYGDTKPLWAHPWGTPSILLKHKRLPFFLVTGPSLRLDENVLGERNMIGFTG